MTLNKTLAAMTVVVATLLTTGCATKPGFTDYQAFRDSRPKSILVLPPLNQSPDINATAGMLAQLTMPLAESGYYVMPVALVSETFKANGLDNTPDMHGVAGAKLREIFGADAALYVTITKYGTAYTVIDSQAVVAASARLVDLKSGAVLWTGSATASNAEGRNNGGAGLVGLLVTAVINQIVSNLADASYPVAGMTSQRLAGAGHPGGLLFGPRSPRYLMD